MSSNLSQLPSAQPASRLLSTPTRDRYGLRLALVFGNHARDGQCPYYTANKCHHCDIGAGEGAAFTVELNRQRLAWYAEHYANVLPDASHLLLYNSGSMLNSQEMPAELLDEILQWTRSLPTVKVVSIESRENFIIERVVHHIADVLGPGRMLRMTIGLETSDDRLRDEFLEKRMSQASIRRAVDAVAVVAASFGSDRIGMTFNILVGGPGTTDSSAIDDALATADFALELAHTANIAADLNLHPYYRSARGRSRFPDHPRCPAQTVARAGSAIANRIQLHAPPPALFIGVEDEGNDQDLIGCDLYSKSACDAVAAFNISQDASVLRLLLSGELPRSE